MVKKRTVAIFGAIIILGVVLLLVNNGNLNFKVQEEAVKDVPGHYLSDHTIVVRAPANHTNYSYASKVLFNATYINGTDSIVTPHNLTAWTNFSGAWTIINFSSNSTNCLTAFNTASATCNGSFNISNMAGGYHTINITLGNISGNALVLDTDVLTTGVRVDNTIPNRFNISSLYLGGSVPESGSNFTGNIVFNVSVIDNNGSINSSTDLASGVTVFANITNSLGVQNGTVTGVRQGSGAGSHWFTITVNTAAYGSGNYSVTFYATDVVGNLNKTFNTTAYGSATKKSHLYFDNTAPAITLSRASTSSKTQLVVDISLGDSVGINSTCGVDASQATIAGSGTSQTMTETGLACGTTYTYIFTCYDEVRNRGQKTQSFATDSCGGGGGSSGSGGSSSTTTWKNTFVENSQDLAVMGSVNKGLAAKERVKLKISGETHYVGVESISGTTATIVVSSDPQSETFNVGDTKKFDINNDQMYELSITLNSINSGTADVTILPIHEVVTPEEESKKTGTTGTTGSPQEQTSTGGSLTWLWILIAIIVVVVIVFFVVRRSRK